MLIRLFNEEMLELKKRYLYDSDKDKEHLNILLQSVRQYQLNKFLFRLNRDNQQMKSVLSRSVRTVRRRM